MSGFIQGTDRHQATLFPERLDDYIAEDNAVRVIDVFLDELDLSSLGFNTHSEETGRPAYLYCSHICKRDSSTPLVRHQEAAWRLNMEMPVLANKKHEEEMG